MARATRSQIWEMITLVFPSLKILPIDSQFQGGTYIKRDYLIKIFFDLKIQKAKALNKEQKQLSKNLLVELL